MTTFTRAVRAYIVRRKEVDGHTILSAWPDEFEAKYEAARWEQDSKVSHDYIEGVLLTERVEDGVPEEAAAATVR